MKNPPHPQTKAQKTPKEYEPLDLVNSLKKNGRGLVKEYASSISQILADLIKNSVGANTFRGFRKKPSKRFRSWANTYLTGTAIAKLNKIKTRSQYDRFHSATREALEKFWLKHGGDPLHFGGATKLINLLLKKVVMQYSGILGSSRRILIPLLHVPHDSFCLAAIRKSASSGRFGITIKIPRNAGMGFITSATEYESVQKLIRNIARRAACQPICIDLLAWDHVH